MRASGWRTAGFVLGGAVIGTLAGQLLAQQVPMLSHSTVVQWNPAGDLAVLRYSLSITLRVNWLTLIGAVVGFIAARRLK
ncbi:MAG: hypothetical protein IRZ10_06060 [Thermoflavifilum sp.]|nr:hypothetical protein [Thermoflavifilum sp.]MCL6513968.1 hypothetical protein [Alicyclobacillus sp.]